MFGLKHRQQDAPNHLVKLAEVSSLLGSHPITTENLLDSLTQFAKIFNAASASVYLYERKTHMFLLKKWVGDKPGRFSISADYEFVTYLKLSSGCVLRDEFSKKSANELRQAALFYFQQTLSTLCVPLIDHGNWVGLLHFDVRFESKDEQNLFESLVAVYASQMVSWALYQGLAEKNKKLSEVQQVKDQLLANVTHELQTPLHGILGVSDALLSDSELDESMRGSISLIHRSGKTLSKTVNDLLQLAQIEAKKNQHVREKVNLILAISEVASLFAETCLKKEVKLSIPQSDQPIYVYSQAEQIRTVLMNLIGNATKFTMQGSIRVSLKNCGDMIQVAVSDTGIGIDQDKLHLIFEEFYQADGSQTRLYGGTGLGLAIVKKIVNLHGGRVWVESEKGQGSTFVFTLPVYPI